jgi:glycosyltransferase involved in cell wall biosynthesis
MRPFPRPEAVFLVCITSARPGSLTWRRPVPPKPFWRRRKARVHYDHRVRVALVHDWLTGLRGGEKALEVFCELFPAADLFTLVHIPGTTSEMIEKRIVRRSAIQWLPFAAKLYREYLPLFPVAVEQFDLDPYDLVISTSHCAAKSVVVTGRARHLCYCLTPMRYAWDQFEAYFGPDRVGAAASQLLRPMMAGMARWDRATEGRVHRYLAISQYVARRIALYYNRESTLVYPPVDTDFYAPASEPADVPPRTDDRPHFLVVSALVPYKRVDLAMMAANQAGVRLTVVGAGPERARLEAFATDGVELVGRKTDEEIRTLYRNCVATILPGEEDFGIVPVESQACGRPVVALGRAGALDTVIDGETGVLVPDPSLDSLVTGLRRAVSTSWNSARIRAHAERFSRTRFLAEVTRVVDETMSAPAGQRW